MEQTIENETRVDTTRAWRRDGRVKRIAAVGVIAALVGVAGILWAVDDGSGPTAVPAPATKSTTTAPPFPAPPTPASPGADIPLGVTPAASPVDAPEPEPVLEDGRHPVLLTDVDPAGATVEFDLVQFLTGDEAREHEERHEYDDGFSPYDYYVVNDNRRLRTLPVLSGVPVTVAYLDPTGGDDSSPVAFADLPGYLRRFDSSAPGNAGSVFWLTVHDDTIVDIHEQWVP